MLRVIGSRYLFPSRLHASPHISTRQYARLVHRWVESIGLESGFYGTHSMRRTKAAQIYRKTGNLRAVQLLLGHTKLESTVRYLGIEVDDALNMAEQIELNRRPPASTPVVPFVPIAAVRAMSALGPKADSPSHAFGAGPCPFKCLLKRRSLSARPRVGVLVKKGATARVHCGTAAAAVQSFG